VDARRLRQSLEAVCREHDALRAHVTQLHAQLGKRDHYPVGNVIDLLRASVDEVSSERDALRQHIDQIHKELANRALAEALPAAMASKPTQSHSARRRGKADGEKQRTRQERDEAWARLQQSLLPGWNAQSNENRWGRERMTQQLEEAQQRRAQELANHKIKQMSRKQLDERFGELELRAKKWAKQQDAARKTDALVQGSDAALTKVMSRTDLARSTARLHERGAKPKRAPVSADERPAWGSRQAQRESNPTHSPGTTPRGGSATLGDAFTSRRPTST